MKKCDAIILASGAGKRFSNKVKKQFFEIDNNPVIAYTISAFEKSNVNNIILVTSSDEIETLKSIVKKYDFKKVITVVEGGEERYLSVYNGLAHTLDTDSDFVMVHDGVRPFVDVNKINELLDITTEDNAYILAKKSTDTLKKVATNEIKETINRDEIYNASTPQCFYLPTFLDCYKKIVRDEIVVTDDSSILEILGKKVSVLEDTHDNIKITTPFDAVIATSIIKTNKITLKSNNVEKSNDDLDLNDGEITIYTDGACSGNPGAGGYGVVMLKGDLKKELSQGYIKTTNNRMELLAVIVALETLKKESKVALYSDSKYVLDSITKGWLNSWQKKGWKKSDGKQVLNIDLWERLVPLLSKHDITYTWVKGHNNNFYNERCDELARNAANSPNLLEDVCYK